MEDSTGRNRLISTAAATSRLVFTGSVEKERGRERKKGGGAFVWVEESHQRGWLN
jgi:hypothetical protein